MAPRTKRILTLFAPPALAALFTPRIDHHAVLRVGVPLLVVMWIVMAGVLLARFALARNDMSARSRWAELDVLTASGAATSWFGAGAIIASGLLGWASLSVIGLLGLATVYITVTWTAITAGGDAPWRDAKVVRTISPEVGVEGEPLRERVELAGIRIPPGMRLFATGRALRHGKVSRYVVDADGSRCEVVLESELGAAVRGEHRAAPLELWLGDVLGLTRSPIVERGGASFTVLPRTRSVDGVRMLLGAGGDDATSRPAQQLPTEGTFRIREYAPGDDARRIHWVRSLQRDELVVRLPDEIPPAEPDVRLILDNELYCAESLSCRAPDELLDALVRVWLGVGKALAEAGTRVTLVTAVSSTGPIAPIERPLVARAMAGSLRLGARVSWQADVPLALLVRERVAKQIVITSRPRRAQLATEVGWIVVPEVAWTTAEQAPWQSPWRLRPAVTLPFPSGAAENRTTRLDDELRRIERMWNDRTVFSQIVCWSDWSAFSGDHIARPDNGRIALGVIP